MGKPSVQRAKTKKHSGFKKTIVSKCDRKALPRPTPWNGDASFSSHQIFDPSQDIIPREGPGVRVVVVVPPGPQAIGIHMDDTMHDEPLVVAGRSEYNHITPVDHLSRTREENEPVHVFQQGIHAFPLISRIVHYIRHFSQKGTTPID